MQPTTRQRERPMIPGSATLTWTAVLICAALPKIAEAQQDTLSVSASNVRLFQSYFSDARITGRPYIGAEPSFSSFGDADIVQLYARGGYTVNPQVEVEGQLGYRRVGLDGDNSGSGLTDLVVTARYLFVDTGDYDIAGGAYLDLPTGDESIGAGEFDFGFYGALRSPVTNRVTLTGTLGVDFVKGAGFFAPTICLPAPPSPGPFPLPSICSPEITAEGDREVSINLGGGVIVRTAQDALHIVSELRIEPEFDYAAISGGPDYYMPAIGRIRGALVIGVDDGSPDFALLAQIVRALR